MPGILITFIIMKSLMNVDVVLKTEIPDIKKKMVQVKIESARNIQQVKMMPGNKQTLSRELKLDWETELYKDTVLCTSDTGQWMFLFWPLRGYGEPNDSFSFEFYRPVLDSVGHQIGDSTEL